MDKKTKSARQIKEEKVEILSEKVARAKSITFTNYHGLGANQLAQLRNQIKKSGGEFLVEKNSLIKMALTKNKLPAQTDQLTGPTAATLAYEDEIAPIKDIAKSNKDFGSPLFKFGFFGSDLLDEATLNKLSLTPSRNALEASLVGSLASPINGFVFALKANLTNLVFALNEIKNQRGGEN